VNQLFNSSEKRLARTLLPLARYGKEDKPQRVLPKISQDMLAEMVGTTRNQARFEVLCSSCLRLSSPMEVSRVATPGEVLGFSDLEQVEACLAHKLLLPREPLLASNFEVSYMVRTSRDTGGDFLDYFYLADERLGIYLGDVVGKRLSAAMIAGLAIGTLRSIHKPGETPAEVLVTLAGSS
jgi:hypothetical protein